MAMAAAPEQETSFLQQVIASTPGDPKLEMCVQCGTCGGSCPSGPDMDHTPRALFAMIRAGLRDDVLRSNTPWYCVSCYYCIVRCPQKVHITDLMYALKNLAIRAKLVEDAAAPGWSQGFIDMLETYGRSYELGLATRHQLRYGPLLRLPSLAPMGLGMLSKGRMDLTPKRIEGLGQMKAILAKAKELEAAL